jgi:hypothetical protein
MSYFDIGLLWHYWGKRKFNTPSRVWIDEDDQDASEVVVIFPMQYRLHYVMYLFIS